MSSAKKLDFLDWVAQESNGDKMSIIDTASNPVIHFEKKGRYIQGSYNGLPVYREKMFESKIEDGDTWICTLKLFVGESSRNYFATPIMKIDANFYYSLSEENRREFANIIWENNKDQIEEDVINLTPANQIVTNEKIKEFDVQMIELNTQINNLKTQIQTKDSTIVALKTKADDLDKQNRELESERDTFKTKAADYEVKLADTVTELTASTTRYNTDMQLKDDKIKALTEENDKLNRAREAIEAARLKKDSDDKTLAIENKQMKSKITALNATIKDLESQILVKSNTIEGYKSSTKEQNNKIKMLQQSIEESANAKGIDSAEYTRMDKQITALKATISEMDEQITDRDNQIASLNAKVKQLTETASKASSGKFSTIIDAYNQQIEQMENQNNELNSIITSLMEDNQKLQRDLEESASKGTASEDLRKQLESEQRKNAELTVKVAELSESKNIGQVTEAVFVRESVKGISSDWLTEDRYNVYINPALRSIRVVASENGTMECINGTITLPGIQDFAPFVGRKEMQASLDENGGMTFVIR